MKILQFEVESRRFGISISEVREVLRVVAMQRLPGAPEVLEGVINVRGNIVPVVDVRRRFGLPAREIVLSDRLIVVNGPARMLAIRADDVSWIAEVEESWIEAAAEVVPGAGYVSGIAKLPDGVLVIHDPRRVLSMDESTSLESALEAAGLEERCE